MEIAIELVKELRDKTGISVMQCQRALREARGDIEKAIAILKKVSAEIALKKANREAKEGRVYIKMEGKRVVLVALHCETDFVAKSEDFVNLLSRLADITLKEGKEKMQAVAKDMIDPIIQKTGEKIELGDVYEVQGSILGSYVHNSKSAAVVSLSRGNQELARDIAMHIVAMKPEYMSQGEITEETKRMVSEIFEKEIAGADKTEDIKKKILSGKIDAYFREKTLLEQIFIKDPSETVGQLLEKNKAEIKEVKRYSI